MAKLFEFFFVLELGSGDASTVTGVVEAETEEEALTEMGSHPRRNQAGDYARIIYRPLDGKWKLRHTGEDLPWKRAVGTWPNGPRFTQEWANAVWSKNHTEHFLIARSGNGKWDSGARTLASSYEEADDARSRLGRHESAVYKFHSQADVEEAKRLHHSYQKKRTQPNKSQRDCAEMNRLKEKWLLASEGHRIR